MADRVRRIAVSTGGGDCPGLNAVIRAVVKTATSVYGWDVLGIETGFDGLLGRGGARVRPLTSESVRGCCRRAAPSWARATGATPSPSRTRTAASRSTA